MSAAASATQRSPAVSSPTVGPRPLQLLESNLSPTSSPVLSPRTASSLGLSTPPPTDRSFKSPNPRRQSSISYFTSDHVDLRSPTISSRPGVSSRRTNSMGIWAVEGRAKGDRRSLGSLMKDTLIPASPGPSVDYGPLTLTEKHADLLQFIAQKESKCLELRSQLAAHEAELAELKRKWERIVSRGMDRAYSTPATPSRAPHTSGATPSFPGSSILPTASIAIKEGVRLLAAGLDLSATEPASPPSMFSPPAVPISGLATVSRATLASTAAMKKAAAGKHAATPSTSSSSTATTSTASTPSQRLSQSSASSLLSSLSLEDPVEEECESSFPSPISEEKPQALAEAVQFNSPRSPHASLRRRSKDADSLPSPNAETSSSARRQSRSIDTPSSPNAAVSGSNSLGRKGSVGKKWEDMQRGETTSKPQKRSSLIFEMSQSFFNALASPAPGPSSPVPSRPSPLSAPPRSLIDEEPEAKPSLGAVMVPQVVQATPSHASNQSVKSADDDDEEWNW